MTQVIIGLAQSFMYRAARHRDRFGRLCLHLFFEVSITRDVSLGIFESH